MTPTSDAAGRRESSEDRRRAIAAAARALILEKGFEGLRTRDIAERVGINVATLHYHVPTKQALIELVAHSLKVDFHQQHLARPRDGLDAVGRLRAEFADYAELLFDRPEVMFVFGELIARSKRDPQVREIVLRMRMRWQQQFADILAEGRNGGLFRADMDPALMAQIITGALASARHFGGPSRDQFAALADELVRSVCNPTRPDNDR
ncbi:MAG: TetR/AcrR family transcriptional regulator [Alphaproteobacteria bacterium]